MAGNAERVVMMCAGAQTSDRRDRYNQCLREPIVPMPEPTAVTPLRTCVAIDDWDAVLRAVQEASMLDARDRSPAPPTPRDASGVGVLVWAQGRGLGTPAAHGIGDE